MKKPFCFARITLAMFCFIASAAISAADFQVRPIAEHETDATKNFTLKSDGGEQMYPVESAVLLDASSIKSAKVDEEHDKYLLKVTLKDKAAERFATQSAKYVGQRLAVMVGDDLKAAPKLQSVIKDGQFVVTLDKAVADDLAKRLTSDATGLELTMSADLDDERPRSLALVGQLANISDHDITVPTDGFDTVSSGNAEHFNVEVSLDMSLKDFKDRPVIASLSTLAPVMLHPGEVAAFSVELDASEIKQVTPKTKIQVTYKVTPKAAKRYKLWSGEVLADEVDATDDMALSPPKAK